MPFVMTPTVAYADVAWDPKTAALVVAACSAAMAVSAGYFWLSARATWGWRPVEGQITHSASEIWETYRRGLVFWGRKVPIYRPDIAYIYTVAGVDYEGKRIFFGDGAWHDSQDHVSAIIERYPPGQKVRVYCSPTSPKLSVLERGQQKGTLRHLVIAAQLGVAALVLGVMSAIS